VAHLRRRTLVVWNRGRPPHPRTCHYQKSTTIAMPRSSLNCLRRHATVPPRVNSATARVVHTRRSKHMAPAFPRRSAISLHTRQLWCGVAFVAVTLQTVAGAAAMRAQGTVALLNPHAVVLADFLTRADGYMRLHRSLLTTAESEGADVAQDLVARRVLAEGIRAARRGASQGEIITPAIAQVLRSVMDPQLRGLSSGRTRASIRDDAPLQFALHVNDTYPEGAAHSTVPPNVLHVLPRLPDGLEYRIVGNHLVLLDVSGPLSSTTWPT